MDENYNDTNLNQPSQDDCSNQGYVNPEPPPPPRIPYMGGAPVRCTRCSNVVTTRFCNVCGLDLSTVYSAPNPPQAPPYMPNQQPPFPYYPAPQYPQKSSAAKTVGIVFGVLAGIFVIAMICLFVSSVISYSGDARFYTSDEQRNELIPNAPDDSTIYYAGGVSVEEFYKLKLGMSYAQISSIIGGDGEPVKSGDNLKGEPYYVYAWPGETSNSVIVYVTITNDKASDISQEGLIKEDN